MLVVTSTQPVSTQPVSTHEVSTHTVETQTVETATTARTWWVTVLGHTSLTFGDQRAELTGETQALLALLAQEPGTEIPTIMLLEHVSAGDDDYPEQALVSTVNQLRAAISAIAPATDPHAIVETTPAGYRLALTDTDATRFETLVREGLRALAGGAADVALSRLDSAIAAWTGAPFADIQDNRGVRVSLERLVRLRAAADEARMAAAALASVKPVPSAVPSVMGATGPDCVGRAEELAWLTAALDNAACRRAQARLVVGSPGLGKSRLVAEVAHIAARRGVTVRHSVAGIDLAEALRADLDQLTLIVLDDLDLAVHDDVRTVVDFLRDHPDRHLLTLITCRDPVRVEELQNLPRLLLGTLDDDAVARIVQVYSPSTTNAAAVAAMVNAGGVPGRVHRLASEWAFGRAGRRIDRAAAEATEPAQHLSLIREQIAEGVLDLSFIRARARQLLPTTTRAATDPYPGLGSFTAADSAVFRGREQLVAHLIARVVEAPVLALVGAAGSGKTSLLEAGLLPALATGVVADSARWRQVIATPTTAGDLARLLDSRPDGDEPSDKQATDEPASDEPASDEPETDEQWASDDESTGVNESVPMLLVIDDFDEVFTEFSRDARTRFFDALLAAVHSGHVRCVVAMRSSTFGRCAERPDLAELVAANTVLITPMAAADLRRAIEEPARLAGWNFDAEVVKTMIADATSGGLLPLAVTLRLLWDNHRPGRAATIADYRTVGGVAGALGTWCERAYRRLGSDDDRDTARRVLLRLADPKAPIGRAVPTRDLVEAAGASATPVIATLVDAGLLRAAGDTLTFARAELREQWPRLRQWLADEAQRQEVRQHLVSAALRWADRGRRTEDLHQGVLLAEATRWAMTDSTEHEPVVAEFLAAGQRAARSDDDRRHRHLRRLRRMLISAAVVLLLTLAGGAVAVVAQQRSAGASVRADAGRVAAMALSEPTLRTALLLAVAATTLDSGATSAVPAVLARVPDLIAVAGSTVGAVAVSPDGEIVVAATSTGDIDLYSGRSLAVVGRLTLANHQPVSGVAFTPRGNQLVSWSPGRVDGSGPPGIIGWDIATRQPTGPAFGQVGPDPAGGLLDDGVTLVLGQRAGADQSGTVVAWSLAARTPSTAYDLPASAGRGVTLSADGRTAAFGIGSGSVVMEPRSGRRRPVPTANQPSSVSPNGRTMLSIEAQTISVWDATTGRRLGAATHPIGDAHASGDVHASGDAYGSGDAQASGDVLVSAWAPDGRTFATGAADGRTVIWDAGSLRPVRVLSADRQPVRDLRYAPDGRTLFAVGAGGALLAWDLAGGRGLGARTPAATDAVGLVQLACALAGRDMTRAEWRRHLPDQPYQHVCPG